MTRAVHVRQHPRRTPNGPTTVGAHNRAAPSHNRAMADDDWFDKHPERIATRKKMQAVHDDELWKAFTAVQQAYAKIRDIPAEELRTPIPGFRDRKWMLEKLNSILADLDTVSVEVRRRVWPLSTGGK